MATWAISPFWSGHGRRAPAKDLDVGVRMVQGAGEEFVQRAVQVGGAPMHGRSPRGDDAALKGHTVRRREVVPRVDAAAEPNLVVTRESDRGQLAGHGDLDSAGADHFVEV